MATARPPQPAVRDVAWKAGPRAERSRAKLIATAKDVFLEHGFVGARVEDIAAAAGVSRGTFYLYFPSKHDVLLAIGVNCVDAGHRLARTAKSIPDRWTRDDLRAWLVGLIDHMDRFGAFAILWRQQVPKELKEQGIEGEHSTARALGRELLRLRGEGSGGDSLSVGLAFLMMTEGLWYQHWRAPDVIDEERLLAALMDAMEHFVGPGAVDHT